ncbi:filamentous hemagglutinin family outer membrane protein, partial [Gloeomargarita lithophora Alchichica-D10]
PSISRVSG